LAPFSNLEKRSFKEALVSSLVAVRPAQQNYFAPPLAKSSNLANLLSDPLSTGECAGFWVEEPVAMMVVG
jgi:hypothetical protein